jgi:hypothetical protein
VTRAAFFAAALALAAQGASVARGQPDDPAYRAVITEAVAEFDAGRFPEARALFLRAHALSPSARTLRGIGMASFEVRDYPEAHRALSAALVEPTRALTAEQATEVRGLLERASRFLGVYRVVLRPASAAVTVDGASVATADAPLLLAIGRHELVARAADHADARLVVDVRGGESGDLTLAPEPAPGNRATDLSGSSPDAGTGTSDPIARPAPAPRDEGGTLGIALLVTGGVVIAGAAGAGLFWWGGQSDEITRCEDAGAACTNLDELRGDRDVAAATTIALAVAGAAAATIGLVIVLGGDGDEPPDATAACAPALLGVMCAGRF